MNKIHIYKTEKWRIEELNDETQSIPYNWRVSSLDKVCNIEMGQSPKGELILKKESSRTISFHQGNTNFNSMYLGSSKNFVEIKNAPKTCEAGDILFSVRAPVGDTNISDKAICFGRGLAALRSFEEQKYLFFALQYSKGFLKKLSSGTIFEAIRSTDLKSLQILVPPKEQQSAIASILLAQESIIQKTEQLISKHELRLKYLSKQLLSGKIRIKEENGRTVFYKNTKWKNVEIDDINQEIPEEWSVSRFDTIAISNVKSRMNVSQMTSQGEYPAFNSSKELSKYSDEYLVDGENIFMATGGKFYVHFFNGKASYSNHVDSYSSDTSKINTKFLYFTLSENSERIDSMFYGAALKNLNKSELKNSEWLLPPLVEQILITNILSQQESLIVKYRQSLAQEKKKFQWLMNNLLSGKYLVSEETTEPVQP